MNLKIIAEQILGRSLLSEEGIQESVLLEEEKRLNIQIPSILCELYLNVGNNVLFIDGFNHFAQMNELFVKDNKLVFLQENQSVMYWAVDLTDLKTVYQTTNQNFDGAVEWFKEDVAIDRFIEMMLYFQCVMSDESFHTKAKSGFRYFASLDINEYYKNEKSKRFINKLNDTYKNIVHANGLSMYWKPKNETIIMYFFNRQNQIKITL